MRSQLFRSFRIFKTVFGIFGLIGLIFLVVGISLSVGNARFREKAVETTAVITAIEEYYDSHDDDYDHTVHVRYYVRDKPVDTILREYSSGMYVGKEITVYYDPENPLRVQGEVSGVLGIIFAVIGGIFFAAALAGLIITRGRGRSAEQLMQTGQREYVPINEVRMVRNITVNGRHPFQIVCEWVDPLSGQRRQFKSGHLWDNPSGILEQRSITAMPVYMDERNPGRYYMDLSELKGTPFSL